MNLTEPFMLKDDVVLIPCAELSDDVRGRISYDEGDFTLWRRHGRACMQIVDGGTAALLQLFRHPRTIAEAVIENSRALGKSPHARLDELLPHLDSLLGRRVLVPAGAAEEDVLRPRYDRGDSIAGWSVARSVHLIEDTEVYEVRRGEEIAALKIARIDGPGIRALFENEAEILRHAGGCGVVPALLDSGVHDGRRYLIAGWIGGVDVSVAAAQRRHDRAALLDLCASVAAAYATLHARGVLHVDVHWRNIFATDTVALVDFGVGRIAAAPPRVARAGLTYFFEPEYASALRRGDTLESSEAGEQYAVAALLYLLLTGQHYVEFRYDYEDMLRQVEETPMLPFSARGTAPWPEVEKILGRALQKDPSRRFGSMAEMAALLAELRDRAARAAQATTLSGDANALLKTTLQSFARGGAMFASSYSSAPKASVSDGCAGAAVGLLRIAEARGDARLLALANVWRSRAAALIGRDEAFYDAGAGLGREELGDVSPHHAEAGIHAAAAMIFASMGDAGAQAQAIAAFIEASTKPCSAIDLTVGRSGSLLAAAMLLTAAPDTAALRAFGAETIGAIWSELDARASLTGSLGMAHGWTGYLYAALRWCAASGDALPSRFAERLGELAALAVPNGRGICWPFSAGEEPRSDALASGWCNGAAGQLFLFTAARRLLGGDERLRLAELCAWSVWDGPRAWSDLCCGTAGRAYALLNFYKHTGRADWLGRARQLANDAAAAAATASRPNALWRGELGVAVLIADLGAPESARMPFFE